MKHLVKTRCLSSLWFFLLILNVACACWTTPAQAQWSSTGPDGASIRCLAIDHQNTRTIYAGTDGGGVFKSTDGGTAWSRLNFAVPDKTWVVSLVIDPQNPQTLYAGTGNKDSGGGILKSSDGGASWNQVTFTLALADTLSLAIDPQNPQTLYAGSNDGSVFKSIDGSTSWNQVLPPGNDFAFLTSVIICGISGLPGYADAASLAIDPQNPETLYAWTQRGECNFSVVLKSTNGGADWSWFSEGLPGTWGQGLAIDPQNSETIYAANGYYGVFKSTNGGIDWYEAKSGLPFFNYVYSLAIDPQNPQTLYSGTDLGVFKSTNGGATWSQVSSGLPEHSDVFFLAVDPQDSETLYAGTTGAGVFKSSDGGGASVSLPGAPTEVSAEAGDAQATVSFQVPVSDGGSPINSYAVYSSSGGFAGQGTGSPITVTGLSNGTAYTFTVVAINAVGAGPASIPSNSVTPKALPLITVTSPKRGEIWHPGQKYTISWKYRGNPGKTVRIELAGGKSLIEIKECKSIGANGKGSYRWTIPKELAAGSNYRVRISTRTNHPSFTAASKGTFSIN